jgi:hypothetical protein
MTKFYGWTNEETFDIFIGFIDGLPIEVTDENFADGSAIAYLKELLSKSYTSEQIELIAWNELIGYWYDTPEEKALLLDDSLTVDY